MKKNFIFQINMKQYKIVQYTYLQCPLMSTLESGKIVLDLLELQITEQKL